VVNELCDTVPLYGKLESSSIGLSQNVQYYLSILGTLGWNKEGVIMAFLFTFISSPKLCTVKWNENDNSRSNRCCALDGRASFSSGKTTVCLCNISISIGMLVFLTITLGQDTFMSN